MQEVEDGVLRADGELADSVGQHVLLLALANVLGEVEVASLAGPEKKMRLDIQISNISNVTAIFNPLNWNFCKSCRSSPVEFPEAAVFVT